MSIVVKNLTHIYNEGMPFSSKALDNISFEIKDRDFVGLIGHTGSGKSTLMKQIVTVTNPTSGKILYNGKDIKSLDDEYRAIVGYLPQDFDAYKNFKAKDFLMYMAALKGMDKETSKKKVDELLKLVGLSEVSNKLVSKFSGGNSDEKNKKQMLQKQGNVMAPV